MRKLAIGAVLGIVLLVGSSASAVVEVAEAGLKDQPSACDNTGEVCSTPLIAGQSMVVGEVSVSRASGELVVTYEITDPAWSITEIHFEVSAFPITESAPGQYYYAFENLNTQFYQFVADDHVLSDCYFAAHAVVTAVTGYQPGPVNLPWFAYKLPEKVTLRVSYPGTESYFGSIVTEGGSLDGTYVGWCIDVGNFITPGTEYEAEVYSSYEDLPDDINIDKPENLPLVNYVINTFSVGDPSPSGGTYTTCDIQRAIWTLVDDGMTGCGTYSPARVAEIVQDAELNGVGFVPGCDDSIAVVLVPVSDEVQVTIAQVTVIDVLVQCGEIPVLGEGDETAWGCGFPIRAKKNWGWYFHCCE